jgi:hypothetical protein
MTCDTVRVFVGNASCARERYPERVIISVSGVQVVLREVSEARELRDALTLMLIGIGEDD